MAITESQQATALRHLHQIHLKYFSSSSRAADWWNRLTPDWRGVILHAAAVNSGSQKFRAHLCNCCWSELFHRLDYRSMIQLKRGISAARQRFEGFGALRDVDFSPRTAGQGTDAGHSAATGNNGGETAKAQLANKARLLELQEARNDHHHGK